MKDQDPLRATWPLTALVHLFALSGFAVAQPLYEILRQYPAFLVAHFAEPSDIVALTVLLSLLVPIALTLPIALVGLVSRRAALPLLVVALALLATLVGLQLARRLTSTPSLDAPLALVFGVIAAWAYWRARGVRRVLSWMALAAAVFPLLFLSLRPVRSLLLPGDATGAVDLRLHATTPVFLLVLDEFPLFSLLDENELIDAVRFPSIAALAADARWYRNATTVAQSTAYSVPAILSGRYPFREKLLPITKDYRINLFTLLGGSYNLNSFETGTRMCPLDLCSGSIVRRARVERLALLVSDLSAVYLQLVAPREMAATLPDIDDGWQGFWGRSTPRRRPGKKAFIKAKNVRKYRWEHPRETAEDFLTSITDYPRPTLHYLHVLLPHAPWRNAPDGHRFNARPPPGLENRIWTGTPWQIAQGLQRHLLQVGFVDRFIGRFRELLESLDLYEDSLIIVVSDHGSGFRAGESRRHLEPEPGGNLIDLANIPLIVKFPGGEPRGLDDRNAETIDVLPTILDSLGLEVDDLELDGSSLAGPPPGRKLKRIYPTRGRRSERGTPIVFAPERLRERREMIRFKIDYLGTGSWDQVFAPRPFGSLVGAGLENPALGSAPEQLSLDPHQSGYEDNLWVSGTLGGGLTDRWVAILIGERVAAVTQTYQVDGAERFGALVAPAALRSDSGVVEVRALDDAWVEDNLP